MKVTRLDIEDVLLIELVVHEDARGFFVERFHLGRFREQGLPTAFVQDNQSRNAPGVLRGLHFQHTPAQGKLVGVTRDDVAACLLFASEALANTSFVPLAASAT